MTDVWPERLTVRPLSEQDAVTIAEWRYAGPWRIYDSRPEDGLLDAAAGYWAVAGVDGPLLGFCCAGPEARVPGLVVEPRLLDIGVGMDPALVGAGHGPAFGQAVLDHFRALGADHDGLRAVVQSWNERSLRLTRRLGFAEVGRHVCEQGGREVEYVVLVAPFSR